MAPAGRQVSGSASRLVRCDVVSIRTDSPLAGQGRLNGVVDVKLVNGAMNFGAVALDTVQVLDDAGVENFLDRGVAERDAGRPR